MKLICSKAEEKKRDVIEWAIGNNITCRFKVIERIPEFPGEIKEIGSTS